jgi:hypothetical protein
MKSNWRNMKVGVVVASVVFLTGIALYLYKDFKRNECYTKGPPFSGYDEGCWSAWTGANIEDFKREMQHLGLKKLEPVNSCFSNPFKGLRVETYSSDDHNASSGVCASYDNNGEITKVESYQRVE